MSPMDVAAPVNGGVAVASETEGFATGRPSAPAIQSPATKATAAPSSAGHEPVATATSAVESNVHTVMQDAAENSSTVSAAVNVASVHGTRLSAQPVAVEPAAAAQIEPAAGTLEPVAPLVPTAEDLAFSIDTAGAVETMASDTPDTPDTPKAATEPEPPVTHLSFSPTDVPDMFQLPPPVALVGGEDEADGVDEEPSAEPVSELSVFDEGPGMPLTDGVYRLGAGDELKVTVWGYPELSEAVVILPNETITYPMIGTVRAAGLSAHELSEAIREAFEPYIESPNVSVTVTEMRSRRVSVLGQVKQPGVYSIWTEQTSVLEIIAQAGGLEADAYAQDLRLFRYDADGTKHTLRLNLENVLNGTSTMKSVKVQPGDVIFVPGQDTRQKICVLGQVNGPGLYTLRANMTLVQALSVAGWVRPSAVLRSVLVARKSDDGEKEYHKINVDEIIQDQDWSQDMRLASGDVVYVPEKFFSKMSTFVGYFTGSVEPAASSYLRAYDASRPTERP